jgi:hypothetical protein
VNRCAHNCSKSFGPFSLAAELIYGTPASTRDPARFSFAHGGKDRTPYPVDQTTYEQTVTILQQALNRAQSSIRTRLGRSNILPYSCSDRPV